ncbi:MAG: ExbD/TolR family protein [Alteromonas sp.]
MKQSVRAKRMARNHRRNSAQGKLSLVSLMDIFTILVFFLMLNASDVQVLQNDKSLTLPKSSTETAAEEQLLMTVSQERILVDGKLIMTIEDVLADQDGELDALANELRLRNQFRAANPNTNNDEDGQPDAFAITIMGDHEIEYQALKKIMKTCAQLGYTNISLAVEFVERESPQAAEGVS